LPGNWTTIRSELLEAIEELETGQRYFTYNALNVLLDADASTATIEDEFDVARQSTVRLDEFRTLLGASE
jgi:hypothetical protein